MKKIRIIVLIVVTMLIVAGPVKAQVFILDDEFEGTMRNPTEDFGLIVPIEGLDTDQYLPLGDGLYLLAVLGGAYLIKKGAKKKKG